MLPCAIPRRSCPKTLLAPALVLCAFLALGRFGAAQSSDGPRNLVFVGTSDSGSSDAYFVVDVDAGELVQTARCNEADNLIGAVWDSQAHELVTSACVGRVLCRVSGLGGPSPVWRPIARRPQSLYGLGWDAVHRRAYVLEGDTSGERALVAVDSDLRSSHYGAVRARTGTFFGASVERWTLAPSGRFAVVPSMLLQGGDVRWIDTDPGSANYMRVVGETPIPGVEGLAICARAVVSPDEQFVFLAIAGSNTNALARLHLPTGRWVDFDPAREGVQHRTLPQAVPCAMEIADDGSFLVLAGQTESGWLLRVDLDRWDPTELSLRELAAGEGWLDKASAAALSPDGLRVCVASRRPHKLLTLDTRTGELLSRVDLPGARNLAVIAWCGPGATR